MIRYVGKQCKHPKLNPRACSFSHLASVVLQASTMNPMNASSGAPALWQEARNPEGRVYYYNTQTKATQWTKPVELMTGVEVSLSTAAYFRWKLTLTHTACSSRSAMEGVHSRWRTQVLVQYREQAEHMGDARGL